MKPKFSLIIALAPYRNAEVLSSLKKVNYDKKKYEIIIEKGYNPSDNRNKGVKKAKSEIIYFLDDDAIVDKTILKNAEDFFDKYKDIDIVGGPQLTPKDDKFFAKMFGAAIESFWGSYKMANRYKKGKLNLNADEFSLTSANCFVKKSIFKKIAGFDSRIWPGEDPEFFARAKRNGFKIAYSPDLIIYHRRRPDLLSFLKQHYKYGNVRLKKERINKTTTNFVMIIPSLFVIYIILLPILVLIWDLFLLPLILYALIALIFSINIAIKKNIIYLPFLPFIFFSMHLSYGIGMLADLFEKK